MATTSDLVRLMRAIEAKVALKYTLTGFPDQPILKQFRSFSEIDGFGTSKSGRGILDDSFLLSEPDLEIKTEAVPQDSGGVKYSISTPLNPNTLRLHPCGLFKGETVISGELLKYSDEVFCRKLFSLFQRETKRQFVRHDAYP